MTEKLNSVCARIGCGRPQWNVAHKVIANAPISSVNHPFEPAAPQPVAGEGPDIAKRIRKVWESDRGNGDYREKLTREMLMAYYRDSKDWNDSPAPEGTPKLEEIKEILASWMSEGTLKFSEFPSSEKEDIESLLESLRPFITPACQNDLEWEKNIHEQLDTLKVPRTDVDGNAFSINGRFAMLRLATPASTGEALTIRCRGCKGALLYKRVSDGEIEVYHDCTAKVSTGEANGWISVSVSDEPHGMPEEGKIVLFVRVGGSIEMGWWRGNSSDRDERWQSVETAPQDELIYYSDEQVTHWQPLPFAPTNVPQAEPPK